MTTPPPDDPFAPRPETAMSPPPQQGYGQPQGYGQQPGSGQPQGYGTPPGYGPGGSPRNGTGTAALVLGIVSLVLFFVPILGLLLGVVALILGVVGRKKVQRNEANNSGVATTGMVLGIVGIVVGLLWVLFIGAIFNKVKDCADPNLTEAESQQCVEDKFNQGSRSPYASVR